MKIDQLPVEMLMKVFTFLPRYDEVSLVSKLFYDIACSMNDPNICLRLDMDNLKDSQWVHSVEKANRKVFKLAISNYVHQDQQRTLSPFTSIIRKFSSTIKFVKFANVFVDESTFLDILSSIPNIERLELYKIHFSTANRLSKCNGVDLNLKKLKSLALDFCGNSVLAFFLCLPEGILTDLRVTDFEGDYLTSLLNQQFNVEKLKLEFNQKGSIVMDKLKLLSLELGFINMDSVTTAAMLSKQTTLKSLVLFTLIPVDRVMMDAVADLSALEVLEMDVTETPVKSLVKIAKLEKLHDLSLRCDGDDSGAKLKMFAESDHSSIVKLSLMRMKGISVDFIAALAKTAPHLKHLQVSRTNLMHTSTVLDGIFGHFNFVDALEVSIWQDPLVDAGNYLNPKLRELSIFAASSDIFFSGWLAKLIGAYPNLEKLKVEMSTVITSCEIRLILDGFTKLEYLTLKSTELIVKDLDYLHDNKNNLKFVSLRGLNVKRTLTGESLQKLQANFGIASLEDHCNLNLAVDRWTMDTEREVYRYYHPVIYPMVHPFLMPLHFSNK